MYGIDSILLYILPEFPHLAKPGRRVESTDREYFRAHVRWEVRQARAAFEATNMRLESAGGKALRKLGYQFFGSGVVFDGIDQQADPKRAGLRIRLTVFNGADRENGALSFRVILQAARNRPSNRRYQ